MIAEIGNDPPPCEGGIAGRFDGRNCDSTCASTYAGARAGKPRATGTCRAQAPSGGGRGRRSRSGARVPLGGREHDDRGPADEPASLGTHSLPQVPGINSDAGDQDGRLDDRQATPRAGGAVERGARGRPLRPALCRNLREERVGAGESARYAGGSPAPKPVSGVAISTT